MEGSEYVSKFQETLQPDLCNDNKRQNKFLTLKRLGLGGQIDPLLACGFLKNVSSKERVRPWFFVTLNIILKYIFPENFIEFPQVVQKI